LNSPLEVIMLAFLFVALVIALRFLFRPLAFAPVGAALLYFGARQPRSRAWIPVVLLAVSDVVLTLWLYGYRLSVDHFVTWAWYAAIVLLGGALCATATPLRLAVAALTTSVSFFVVSNFAVWATWRSMYPATLSGLAACYTAALPFFRNQIAADFLGTAVFFGIGALLGVRKPARITA
jgi:hypothetical protein